MSTPPTTESQDSGNDAPPPDRASRPLRPFSKAWRLTATFAALAVLTAGQIVDTNDWFPLGSLSQYATPRDLDGTVRSVTLRADFPDAEDRHVALSEHVVGTGRAEVEGQLQRFIDDPELLGVFARSYAQLNPGRPLPEVLYLKRSTQQLRDGEADGEPTVEILVEWHAG
ncbi:hypothetical protein [Pseudactinotalea sp. HY158]|uniref:hypothetical protein n=1 Tax=Pseudactinotalea sp. HY158 TaxID=2654547 RepID=UPI00129C2710|nr:hypothetical protein [Pseudactinotalea sp. HY158]QGH68454.1 hypothetical protein GCE65_02225 [Pseudactinotalea sp. HY158]